jgi:hypothetical protein
MAQGAQSQDGCFSEVEAALDVVQDMPSQEVIEGGDASRISMWRMTRRIALQKGQANRDEVGMWNEHLKSQVHCEGENVPWLRAERTRLVREAEVSAWGSCSS